MFEYWHSGWHMWWMQASWIVGLVMVVPFMWAWVHGTAFRPSGPQEGPETIHKRRDAQGDFRRRFGAVAGSRSPHVCLLPQVRETGEGPCVLRGR